MDLLNSFFDCVYQPKMIVASLEHPKFAPERHMSHEVVPEGRDTSAKC